MKTFTKTLATLVLGMALGSATLAAAAPGTIEGVLTKFKIVVNGQEAQLNNTPVVIKGTTYLPVREVAGLLDAGLNYDGKNKTIELNTKGSDELKVPSAKTITFRELVELLSNKYPDKKVSLTADGTLYFGEEQYQLNYQKSSDSQLYINAKDIFDLNLLNDSDIQ